MSRRLVRGASIALTGGVLAGAVIAAVAAAAPASAEGPGGGPSASSPSNGRYVAWVEISGNGAGHGGSLAGPPVSVSGGGRVAVPSPCGYQRGETQQAVEQAYLDANGGDEARAKAALLNDANRMAGTFADYSLPNSTVKARLQYENWGRTGVWYDSICDASVSNAAYRTYVNTVAPPVLTNGGPPPPPQLIADPLLLHDIAVRAMTLPDPAVQVVGPRTVVRLGTYVWVRPDDTATRTVTASVPGLSVTVTAVAQNVTFTTTGAPAAVCGVVRAQTPNCALTYTRSSARAPGQKFSIVGLVDWTATATDGIPVPGARMVSPAYGITVLEVQTLNGGAQRWTS
ncbi:MAG TPA: hypothetical protein VF109_04855 [Mycobacteriales bacterium]